MAVINPKSETFGARYVIVDFSKGLYTLRPQDDIPDNASPRLANLIQDYRFCLGKIWGTWRLENASGFFTSPIYNLYNYVNIQGESSLIIQAEKNGVMGLYYIKSFEDTPVLIKNNLAKHLRMSFATYKGRLYFWNGQDPLRYWDGGSLVREYHADKPEKFMYLCTYNRRLWAASSPANPSRLIYSDYNYCNFDHYFNSKTNYIDFSEADRDYSPIMAIVSFKDSLIIFKTNSIFRLFGDPASSINFSCVSHGIGTINSGTVQVWNDRIYFAYYDGIYVLGDTSVATDEDNRLRSQSSVVRISTEIDNFWRDNVILPNPKKTKQKVWSGDDLSGFTMTNCQYTTPPISNNPGVIIARKYLGHRFAYNDAEIVDWVDLISGGNPDKYWGQSAKCSGSHPIPNFISLKLKTNGDIPDGMKLKVLICADNQGKPDTNLLYGEGQVLGSGMKGVWELTYKNGNKLPAVNDVIVGATSGATGVVVRMVHYGGFLGNGTSQGIIYIKNKTGTWQNNEYINIQGGSSQIAITDTGGDAIPITNGCRVAVEMTYHDYPQNLYNGNSATPPTFYVIVQTEGEDSNNFLKWAYSYNNYHDGRMINSDESQPPDQTDFDYLFEIYGAGFYWDSVSFVIPPTFIDANLIYWGNLYVNLNEDAIGGYVRYMRLIKLEYAILNDPGGTPNWVTIQNGGSIGKTIGDGSYITVRATFANSAGLTPSKNDSMTVLSVRVSYSAEILEKTLMSSAIYQDRYYLSIYDIIDEEQIPI